MSAADYFAVMGLVLIAPHVPLTPAAVIGLLALAAAIYLQVAA